MSDFDPDAYLAAKKGALADAAPFDPDAYLAAKLGPVQAEEAPKLDRVTAGGLKIARGASLGLLERGGSVVDAAIDKLTGKDAAGNPATGTFGERYDANLARNQGLQDSAQKDYPTQSTLLELAGGLAAPIPGANAGKGLGLGGRVLLQAALGAGAGGVYGAGTSREHGLKGIAEDAGLGAVLGGAAGAGGDLLGSALSGGAKKLAGRAAGRVRSIDESVLKAAADEAASATASARSAAGAAAQDAYRQLEHLRELGRLGALTPEQEQVAAALASELAGKAQEKLLPAASRKAATAEEYAQAMTSEAERAKQLAAEKLSGAELKRQVLARVKRYGLPALGGAALAAATGHSSPMELLGAAGIGSLGGAGMRPMMHSLLRMAKQPVVQRPIFNALESAFGGVSRLPGSRLASPLGRALTPEMETSLMPLFADDDNERQRALAAALRTP